MRNILYTFLKRRHFWRYATFSEVNELYISRVLRMVAINTSFSFVSVFLYQNGYSVIFILVFWALYYAAKVVMALPLAQYTARYGPKHGILLSNFLYIPAMVLYPLVPTYGLSILAIAGVLQGAAATLYMISYTADFSKVKRADRAGKEIAYMSIFERVATGVSPLLGGLVALIAGPTIMIWFSAILFATAAIPLFKTGEPIDTHQKLLFRGFPWRMSWRSMVGSVGVGIDICSAGTVWPFMVGIVIIGASSGNDVYAVLGGLTSVVVVASVIFSYLYGVLIDRRRGGVLLKTGVIANSTIHMTRPFIDSTLAVGLVNVMNEAATSAYAMAYTRAMFDVADRTGHRVTYAGLIEMMQNVGTSLAAAAAAVAVLLCGDNMGLKNYFFIAGVGVLLILLSRFPLYRR